MKHREATDVQLMDALAGGDAVALEELYCRYQHKVFALARRMIGNQGDVEDIVQETYLRVLRAAGSFRQTAQFSTWLYRIVVNLCQDRLRRPVRPTLQLKEDIPERTRTDPQQVVESKEEAVRVSQAVDRLLERQRIAIILHRYEHLSHEEIAMATGWTVSAVESLLVRAYQHLRQELADLE